MNSKISLREFIYGYLLVMTSGNPFFRSKLLLVVIFLLLLLSLRPKRDIIFIKNFLTFCGFSSFIFILQYFYWGQIPLSFISGYFVRIGIGGILFYKLKDRLAFVLWKIVVYSSLIAFPFYLIHLFYGNIFNVSSICLYTFRYLHSGETILRNSGFGWEPGVFQIYINVVLFLNIHHLLKYKRWEIITLVISLFTTFSTTGYLIFFIILFLFLYDSEDQLLKKWKRIIPFFFIIAIVSFGYIYFNSNFLHEKLKNQIEAISSYDDSFSQNRFLTFLFDLKYIKMNPLLGNGYNFEMRYTDEDQRILSAFMDSKDNTSLGAGNGISDMVSRYGLLYVISFFSLFYNRLKELSLTIRLSFLLLILLLLWGEPMMNYPFFMALPLIYINNRRSLL